MLCLSGRQASLQEILLSSRQAGPQLLPDCGVEQVAEHAPTPLLPGQGEPCALHAARTGVPWLGHQVVTHTHSLGHPQAL